MQSARFVLSASLACLLVACSGENAEKAASGAMSKAVELAKGAATGASKGVEEGRKSSSSMDGAVIVSNGDELVAALTGEVLQAVPDEPIQVSMGFENVGEVPVRVTELARNNHVTALDAEGYVCKTAVVDPEFTVPAKAKLKVDMAFDCEGKSIREVRIYDKPYPVASDRIAAKTSTEG